MSPTQPDFGVASGPVEVQWYDDEGHGWEKLETKRDAFGRILGFLRRHVLDEPPT